MRRILHLVLAGFIALLPTHAFSESKRDASGSSGTHKKHKKVKKAAAEEEAEAARAQGEEEESQGSKRKKKRRPKVIEVSPEGEATEVTPAGADQPEKETTPAAKPPAPAVEEDEEGDGAPTDFEDDPSQWLEALGRNVPPRRYAYVIGAIIGGTGLVFAYQAQGEAKRAETITSALEAQRAVGNARASAALANVMYGLAGAAILLALILELLPEPAAEKAALTFHF